MFRISFVPAGTCHACASALCECRRAAAASPTSKARAIQIERSNFNFKFRAAFKCMADSDSLLTTATFLE